MAFSACRIMWMLAHQILKKKMARVPRSKSLVSLMKSSPNKVQSLNRRSGCQPFFPNLSDANWVCFISYNRGTHFKACEKVCFACLYHSWTLYTNKTRYIDCSAVDRAIADPTFAKKGELPQESYISHKRVRHFRHLFLTLFPSIHISFEYLYCLGRHANILQKSAC